MPILTTLGAACAKAWGFTSGLAKDQYFNLVSLLLPGNGTNGAQNNTFLDSSTNNFTITRNGNTTQGTFSPFSQTGWGAYFDGSNDSLTVPSGSSISGTGNFTVECWMYPLTFASGYRVFYANETSGGLSLLINSTGTLSYGRALVAVDGTTTGTVNFNQWNHVAFVRSGTGSNQFICYINGQSAGSFTNSTSYSSGIVRIGTDGGGINYPFPGYLSNIRSVIIAVYTGNFTPPIAPLTATQSAGTNISAITGTQTSLLTCQSNRFVDNGTANSGSGFIVTAYNGTAITPFSPFAPTAAYTTSAVGGSGYFDGTGDYLSVANTGLLGSGDWTVEMWINAPVGQTDKPILECRNPATGSGSTTGFTLTLITSTEIRLFSGSELLRGTVNYINTWAHVAVSKKSGTTRLYLNGMSVASTASLGTMSDTTFLVAGGYYGSTSVNTYGQFYMSGLRVLTGTGYDTSNITIPTSPPTAITNTSLLLNFTNAGITDATAKNDLETVGNAQISTSVSKFGGGSIAFDGTGDYLKGVYSPLMILSGDFTIECWLYYTAHGSYGGIVSFANSNTAAAPTSGWAFVFYAATNNLYFETGTGFTLQTTNTVPSGTWNHVAVVRSGSTITHYLNGTANGSGSSSATFTPLSTDNFVIGVDRGLASTITGYIDDMRISRYARYTGNFTPPSAPFPVQ